jgi:hypothetical protein
MIRSYLHARYAENLDFTGKNLISLLDSPKQKVKAIIPVLMDAPDMTRRWTWTRKLRARDTGDVADEIHEFLNARQGRFRLRQISFKDRCVIQIVMAPEIK